jgi:urease accessory protein
MSVTVDPLLWLLQASDTAYPSGAYAHSFGLEELVESGVVRDAGSLEHFLVAQILPALLTFDLPFFALAHRAAVAGDAVRLTELDAELDAWRLPAEVRDASRRIGSQRLKLLRQLAPSALVEQYAAACPLGHHLPVAAIECIGVPIGMAARAHVFQAIAGFISASMKLLRIGQTACQSIQHRSMQLIGPEIDSSVARQPDGWFNPLLEIASLRHARAHARLFIS